MIASCVVIVAACAVVDSAAMAQASDDAIDIFGVYTPPIFRTMPPVTQPAPINPVPDEDDHEAA